MHAETYEKHGEAIEAALIHLDPASKNPVAISSPKSSPTAST